MQKKIATNPRTMPGISQTNLVPKKYPCPKGKGLKQRKYRVGEHGIETQRVQYPHLSVQCYCTSMCVYTSVRLSTKAHVHGKSKVPSEVLYFQSNQNGRTFRSRSGRSAATSSSRCYPYTIAEMTQNQHRLASPGIAWHRNPKYLLTHMTSMNPRNKGGNVNS